MLIRKKRGWEIPERDATPEDIYLNRREILRGMGFAGVGLGTVLAGLSGAAARQTPYHNVAPQPEAVRFPDWPATDLYPAERNPSFGEESTGRTITPPGFTLAYNNFYEFRTNKAGVWRLVENFETRPWQIEIGGLVDNPGVWDVDELIRKMPLEERIYRFRCVEAWAATVPWTGFPLRELVDLAQPTSAAKYLRFETLMRPEQMVGIPEQHWYPWPFHDGLTIEEARHELAMLVTGAYGRPLPKQNGAPIRLITPWKFGFKQVKSIVKIEFTAEMPDTFWNTASPDEYTFWANINPEVPHPRWSQAMETVIDTGEQVPTLLFNGYAEWIGDLYSGLEEEYGIWLYR